MDHHLVGPPFGPVYMVTFTFLWNAPFGMDHPFTLWHGSPFGQSACIQDCMSLCKIVFRFMEVNNSMPHNAGGIMGHRIVNNDRHTKQLYFTEWQSTSVDRQISFYIFCCWVELAKENKPSF